MYSISLRLRDCLIVKTLNLLQIPHTIVPPHILMLTRITLANEKKAEMKGPSTHQQNRHSLPSNLTCIVCGRVCGCRIGLLSHNRTHYKQNL